MNFCGLQRGRKWPSPNQLHCMSSFSCSLSSCSSCSSSCRAYRHHARSRYFLINKIKHSQKCFVIDIENGVSIRGVCGIFGAALPGLLLPSRLISYAAHEAEKGFQFVQFLNSRARFKGYQLAWGHLKVFPHASRPAVFISYAPTTSGVFPSAVR